MNPPSDIRTARKSDRQRIAELDLESLSERELRDLYDEIFGEPGDEEIAEALRQAEAEYAAGDYAPTPLDADAEDAPYREPTGQETLEDIWQTYKQMLAGEFLTLEEYRKQLRE